MASACYISSPHRPSPKTTQQVREFQVTRALKSLLEPVSRYHSGTGRRSRARTDRMKVKTAVAACVSALSIGVIAGTAAPASAATGATVSGCAQGWSSYTGTCIWVVTGSKNASNHTQWVSQITVQAPRGASAGKLEAWAGNGPTGVAWYRSGNGTYVTWSINMWIKNGSGICGAYTYPGTSSRSIACITISV